MPIYEYIDTESGKVWEEFWSYDKHQSFLERNPHVNQNMSINLVGAIGDRVKADGGMNDLLGRIARANPTSPLADQYGDKGIKATKSREAVRRQQKKHTIDTSTI